MSHYEPKEPFDGYDPDGEYPEMMGFCTRVESLQANALGEWLNDKFGHPGMKVIDVGCGPGIYLLPFIERGAKVLGIDACLDGGKVLPEGCFQRVDLRFPFVPEEKFNLAICLEVGEHLERHWSERLVDTLSDCADIIVFSAAVPGQGGTYHVNEQPHEFWLEMFKERHNFVVHPLQDEMREFLSQFEPQRATGEVSGWLIDNTFILIKEEALLASLDGDQNDEFAGTDDPSNQTLIPPEGQGTPMEDGKSFIAIGDGEVQDGVAGIMCELAPIEIEGAEGVTEGTPQPGEQLPRGTEEPMEPVKYAGTGDENPKLKRTRNKLEE
jgi:SAM-dependent methyltransferase